MLGSFVVSIANHTDVINHFSPVTGARILAPGLAAIEGMLQEAQAVCVAHDLGDLARDALGTYLHTTVDDGLDTYNCTCIILSVWLMT